ncbi:adenosylcobinamide-GDP ribazoletransferase [Spinactinospora alkalitolerans]|nr:adenosylcobinamide-GDP ribazoletransferase [Spinactinospora alkalitolerans]
MALGTLTVLPVRVERVDRAVAGWAMALAPLAGLLLGLLGWLVFAAAAASGLSATPAAALAVGALALLTRGLHLDGLADLADGLGSARPAEGALEVMKRSDIGPFGVLTLVLTVLLQVLALAQSAGHGAAAVLVGLVAAVSAGRLAITWACARGVPAARPEGLGALVAGTVPRWAAVAATATVVLPAGFAGAGHAIAVLAGLAAAGAMLWHATRRLGGITGDVLGALAETATTTTLLVAAALQ